MNKSINNENEMKLKTIFLFLFCEQDIKTFVKIKNSIKALFNNVNIPIESIIRSISEIKKNSINYEKLDTAYILSKKIFNNNEYKDYKIFFDKFLNDILKEDYTSVGRNLDKSYIFSTKQSCRKRERITLVQVLSDKNGIIHGMNIEYDGIYKTGMFPNQIKDKLSVSLEIKLKCLKEEVIKENEEEKVILDDEFYLDEISYIFGTINNKSRYITFLGFKCISGKIAFVGEPDGDGFLFGKLGKRLQNMIIQMTEKGINKIEPEFKKIPKKNYFLRKLIKKIPNHIEEDEEIQMKRNLKI